jgi:hypothetical protein
MGRNERHTNTGEREMTRHDITVCGCQIQHDNSGVGHNWRDIAADDINADVRQAIEAEVIDGQVTECDDWTGPDGQHYRWTEA